MLESKWATKRISGKATAILLMGLFFAAQCSPVPAREQQGAEAMLKLNDTFRSVYKGAVEESLATADPVILLGGGKLVLLRSGKREEVEYVPAQYRILKTVDHIPLAVFVILVNHADKPLSEKVVEQLKKFRDATGDAQAQMAKLGLSTEAQERARAAISQSSAFIDKVLAAGQISKSDLYNFARQNTPALMDNAYDAVTLELGALNKQVMAWKEKLSPAEWDSLRVIVMGGHMPRQQEREMQYFQMLLGEREEGNRIVYFEGGAEEQPALDLLGKHMVDGAIGDAFFGDPMRMHRDLLSDAARRYLREHAPEPVKLQPAQ
jgi:hypothetical protein